MTSPSDATPAPHPPLNRAAVWSLIAGACLVFPLGLILGVLAVVQIRTSRGAQQGLVLAGLGIALSGVIIPAGLALLLTTDPAVLNSCRTVQHQAEGTLRVIRFLEKDYKGDHGRYGSLEEIGFTSMHGDTPYRYELAERSDEHYVARAVGNGEMEGDLLQIEDGGDIEKVVDVCRRSDRPRP